MIRKPAPQQTVQAISSPSFWLALLPPLALGAIASWVGVIVPTLGAPVVGILLGLIVGQIIGQPRILAAGTRFCSRTVLQTSIVLFGAGMSLSQVASIGGAGLPVMLATILVAITAGTTFGRWLRVERETRTLVTYGTSICGASAIATMSQVIGAEPSAVAISIAVIVVYNVLAAFIFPTLGLAMHLSPESFGLWSGTAVNDTSSVVAAASSYDHMLLALGVGAGAATSYAVVVKLTRTLAIIPLSVYQAWSGNRRTPAASRSNTPWWRLVPTFLVFFLVAAGIKTVGLIPAAWDPGIAFLAHYGTTVAMSAVGMSSSLTAIKDAGWRPLALGAILWVLIAVTSLVVQYATGQLHTF